LQQFNRKSVGFQRATEIRSARPRALLQIIEFFSRPPLRLYLWQRLPEKSGARDIKSSGFSLAPSPTLFPSPNRPAWIPQNGSSLVCLGAGLHF
jgi:hypothetical protein